MTICIKVFSDYNLVHYNIAFSGFIDSVRWSPCGKMLATASSDCVVKVLDLSTEKIIHQWHTADRRNNSLLYTQLIEIIYLFSL